MKHVTEATRYLENAKEILRVKANKQDGFYQYKKYVKLAGHAAYTGVLLALDGTLEEPGIGKKGRKNVEWYQKELSQIDKSLLYRFLGVYDTLHLSLGYDGNPDAKVAKAGLENAEKIIKWAETRSAA
jgi:hypothetical protein